MDQNSPFETFFFIGTRILENGNVCVVPEMRGDKYKIGAALVTCMLQDPEIERLVRSALTAFERAKDMGLNIKTIG